MEKINLLYLSDFVGKKRGSELSIDTMLSMTPKNFNIFRIENKNKNIIKKELKKLLKKQRIDFIIGQNKMCPFVVKISKRENVKSVIFINDTSFLETANYKPIYIKIVKKILIFPKFKKTINKANIVISNSLFMKNKIYEKTKRNSNLIYPAINFDKNKIQRDYKEGKFIGMAIPTKNKGIDIFLKIAKKMPNEFFLIAGDYNQETPLNVKVMGYQKDMKEFYSKLKLLIVPSIWNEAFGMVVVEAQENKIPVISSNKGGLQEVNAGSKIKDIYDIKKWVKEIKKYEKKAFYLKKQEEGLIRNQKFYLKKQSNKFYNLLK